MSRKTRDLVFLDTETLGRYLDSPIWEVAAIRRDATTGEETQLHVFVQHVDPDVAHGYDELPESFKQDYANRYDAETAVTPGVAAVRICHFMAAPPDNKPKVIGRVPSFDTARIHHQLLAPVDVDEPWHYASQDISDIVLGYLHGVFAMATDVYAGLCGTEPAAEMFDRTDALPDSSDELARAVGVNPDDYHRHSAMGDVRWVRAQYDAVTSGGSVVVAW